VLSPPRIGRGFVKHRLRAVRLTVGRLHWRRDLSRCFRGQPPSHDPSRARPNCPASTLAAIAQNLRRLAKLVVRSPLVTEACIA
jgi:hypothetical protein